MNTNVKDGFGWIANNIAFIGVVAFSMYTLYILLFTNDINHAIAVFLATSMIYVLHLKEKNVFEKMSESLSLGLYALSFLIFMIPFAIFRLWWGNEIATSEIVFIYGYFGLAIGILLGEIDRKFTIDYADPRGDKICPNCGEKVEFIPIDGHVIGDKYREEQKCPECKSEPISRYGMTRGGSFVTKEQDENEK